MLYMSGSTVQIFSITMTFMLLSSPFKALISVGQTFRPFETPARSAELFRCKAAFVLIQLGFVALGVWKCNQMGILPTSRSDWLAWESRTVCDLFP
jgi:hypothetical protein